LVFGSFLHAVDFLVIVAQPENQGFERWRMFRSLFTDKLRFRLAVNLNDTVEFVGFRLVKLFDCLGPFKAVPQQLTFHFRLA
jgi:hypothetical protein